MRYYMHDGPSAFRFELAGDLDANDAGRLERDWRTASSTADSRTLIIDMSFVTGIDETARGLFRRWHAEGAEFAAGSERSRELVESITERPFTRSCHMLQRSNRASRSNRFLSSQFRALSR